MTQHATHMVVVVAVIDPLAVALGKLSAARLAAGHAEQRLHHGDGYSVLAGLGLEKVPLPLRYVPRPTLAVLADARAAVRLKAVTLAAVYAKFLDGKLLLASGTPLRRRR